MTQDPPRAPEPGAGDGARPCSGDAHVPAPGSFEAWYREHGSTVVRALALDAGDERAGQQLAVQVCAELAERWEAGDPPADPLAWSVVRGFQLSSRPLTTLADPPSERAVGTDQAGGWAQRVVPIVGRLPTDARQALILHLVAELDLEATAAALGTRVAATSVLIRQGRELLAGALPPEALA